jgi:hypothetical protein
MTLNWCFLSILFLVLLLTESTISTSHQAVNFQHENGDLCGHQHILNQLNRLPKVNQNYQTETRKISKRSVDQNYTTDGLVTDSDFRPIRIYFDLRYLDSNVDPQACYSNGTIVNLNSTQYQCTDADILSIVKANNTALIISALQSIISKKIQLRSLQVMDTLVLDSAITSCGFDGGVPVPIQYRQSGIPNTDLMYVMFLFFSLKFEERERSTLRIFELFIWL